MVYIIHSAYRAFMDEIISYGRFRCNELGPHKNKGMEITFVEKGMLEWMVAGALERVTAGSIFFTLPWQVHGSVHPREPDNMLCHVLFHLAEDYPEPRPFFGFPACLGLSKSEMKILSGVFSASPGHCFRATPTMRFLIPVLIGELQGSHPLRDTQVVSLLRSVLIELKRIVAGEAVDADVHSWSERRVDALLVKFAETCDQGWSLAQMALECGLQRTQLTSIVRKLTGCTPMEYLGRVRIERAKNLLRETDMKIIDIALECGFSTSQYFANTFHRSTELTPSVYRAQSSGLSQADVRKLKRLGFRSEREERERIEQFSGT